MATDFYNTSYDIQVADARRRRALAALAAQQQTVDLGSSTSRALGDVNRQYAQGLEPRVSGFGRRGLGRSGIFQRAMKEYATNQQRAVGDINLRQQQGLAGIDLQSQQDEQNLQAELNRLAIEKQQKIIDDAAQLADYTRFSS